MFFFHNIVSLLCFNFFSNLFSSGISSLECLKIKVSFPRYKLLWALGYVLVSNSKNLTNKTILPHKWSIPSSKITELSTILLKIKKHIMLVGFWL